MAGIPFSHRDALVPATTRRLTQLRAANEARQDLAAAARGAIENGAQVSEPASSSGGAVSARRRRVSDDQETHGRSRGTDRQRRSGRPHGVRQRMEVDVRLLAVGLILPLMSVSVASAASDGDLVQFSGDQHAVVFPAPLGILAVDSSGNAVAGVSISVRIESGTAVIRRAGGGVGDPGGETASAVTDSNGGLAIFAAGPMPGPVVVSVRAIGDPAQSLSLGEVTKSFNLVVDTPGWPNSGIPDTGGPNRSIVIVAGLLLATGVGLLLVRRRAG